MTKMSFAIVAAVMLAASATSAAAADLSSSQQNALVRKYCAVCHSDAANNGGLSLEHYEAARPDPPLAAMLLSKLRNGAMGAAGFGVPDPDTQAAWVAATVSQAVDAEIWTVTRTGPLPSHDSTLTASIVRRVAARKGETNAPVYRLILACDTASRQGTIQLTWSPEPQTNRTFLVSADGQPGVPQALAGQEKMGNGSSSISGRASAALQVGMPAKTLTVTDLFPAETVVFPIDTLDIKTRLEFAACGGTRN